jgi:hypothetical protein
MKPAKYQAYVNPEQGLLIYLMNAQKLRYLRALREATRYVSPYAVQK